MDIIYFLSSINKLSLVAFLITLVVLVYEIRLLQREKLFRVKPKIPKFDESANPQLVQATTLIINKPEKVTKVNNLVIIVLVVLLIIFGLAVFFGFSNYNQKSAQSTLGPTPIVNIVTSKGIKIFDNQFNPISDLQLSNIKPGEEIIIGIATVKDANIDRARIRVNKADWLTNDITVAFSPKNQIYYLKYIVATGESKLKIEAQLHSVIDGWLGD